MNIWQEIERKELINSLGFPVDIPQFTRVTPFICPKCEGEKIVDIGIPCEFRICSFCNGIGMVDFIPTPPK